MLSKYVILFVVIWATAESGRNGRRKKNRPPACICATLPKPIEMLEKLASADRKITLLDLTLNSKENNVCVCATRGKSIRTLKQTASSDPEISLMNRAETQYLLDIVPDSGIEEWNPSSISGSWEAGHDGWNWESDSEEGGHWKPHHGSHWNGGGHWGHGHGGWNWGSGSHEFIDWQTLFEEFEPIEEEDYEETTVSETVATTTTVAATDASQTQTTTVAPTTSTLSSTPQPVSGSDFCGVGVTITVPPKNRIVGGYDSKPGGWPWLVSVEASGRHICGGSLVRVADGLNKTDIVVTAAHCVSDSPTNPGKFSITAGQYSLSQKDATEQTSQVKALHYPGHPGDYGGDVAVLTLETPIAFRLGAMPVCLPRPGDDPSAGTNCIVTGWGSTKETFPDKPKEVAVPILSDAKCQQSYSINPPNEICAGLQEGGKDSCQGDSGGPLNCLLGDGERWALTGVVSWGDGCAEPDRPGVYAQTSNFLPFIRQRLCATSAFRDRADC